MPSDWKLTDEEIDDAVDAADRAWHDGDKTRWPILSRRYVAHAQGRKMATWMQQDMLRKFPGMIHQINGGDVVIADYYRDFFKAEDLDPWPNPEPWKPRRAGS